MIAHLSRPDYKFQEVKAGLIELLRDAKSLFTYREGAATLDEVMGITTSKDTVRDALTEIDFEMVKRKILPINKPEHQVSNSFSLYFFSAIN